MMGLDYLFFLNSLEVICVRYTSFIPELVNLGHGIYVIKNVTGFYLKLKHMVHLIYPTPMKSPL